MIFLPIAERELRVSARKRSTFVVRMIGALGACVIGVGFLLMSFTGVFGPMRAGLGPGLFGTLTWISLAVALSAGLFFTSDCLSEEKREGTLGFLFLTELTGYDVVLGKLLATSLRSLCAFLALFPILAITLIMGGVTGSQFWKTTLALLNALFISLSTGLFISALSRDSQKAMAGTLFLLLSLSVATLLLDGAMVNWKPGAFEPILSLANPAFLFVEARSWGANSFWSGLIVNQALGWLLFGVTCFLVPRTWQDAARETRPVKIGWRHWWKFGGTKRQLQLRGRLIGINPVLWLVCRERWQALALWIAALLVVGAVVVAALADIIENPVFLAISYLSSFLILFVYLGIASHAGRFFVEGRRSGLIELLLATPLTARQIIQGQWRAVVRMFVLPLIVYLVAQLIIGFLAQQQTFNRIATAATAAPAPRPPRRAATNTVVATNSTVVTTTISPTTTGAAVTTGPTFSPPNPWLLVSMSIAGTLIVAANLTALLWFGMWMGLTSKSTNLSTLKTILFVQIIPWFVISFVSAMIVPVFLIPWLMKGLGTPGIFMTAWFPVLMSSVATVLYIVKDTAFALWARKKLYAEFRERASQTLNPAVAPGVPPLISQSAAPPVIAKN